MRQFAGVGALIAAVSAASPAPAQVVVTSGVDHASGRYDTGQRIATSSASLSVNARRKRLTLFATVPVVRSDAPGNVVVTGGPLGLPILIDPTRPATRVRRQGFGDAVAGVGVQALPARDGHLALTLGGAVKLPTASAARGLGTGKPDVALTADLARPARITPFGSFGYTLVGQPAGYRLKNVASAKGGLTLRVGRGAAASVSYNYASRVSDLVANRREIEAGAEAALGHRLSLGLQGTAGLSKGAPDAAVGARLGLRL